MNSLNSLCVIGVRSFSRKTLSILIRVYKMENNYETLGMLELKALAREHRLRGYSRLRKADLIAFLQNNEHRAQRPPSPPPQEHAAPASQDVSLWGAPKGRYLGTKSTSTNVYLGTRIRSSSN